MPISTRFFTLLSALMLAPLAVANSPQFGHTLPDGGQRGSDVAVTIGGQRLDGLEEVLFYEPGITATNLEKDRKSTRLNSSHIQKSRMPSSA